MALNNKMNKETTKFMETPSKVLQMIHKIIEIKREQEA